MSDDIGGRDSKWKTQWIEPASETRFGYELLNIFRATNSLEGQREEVANLLTEYKGTDISGYTNVLAQLLHGSKVERDYSMREQRLWADYELEPVEQKRVNGALVNTPKYVRYRVVAERHGVSEKTVEAAVNKMKLLGFGVLGIGIEE